MDRTAIIPEESVQDIFGQNSNNKNYAVTYDGKNLQFADQQPTIANTPK